MKTTKITYWITTVIIAVMMVYSFYAYLTQPAIKQAFEHLGFPNYFRVELAVCKLIGAILLLQPLSKLAKEWAYAGFAITFVSAFIAHTSSGDPAAVFMAPVIFLVILAVSYFTYHRLQKAV
jgi:preprotein translocase subunit YajC